MSRCNMLGGTGGTDGGSVPPLRRGVGAAGQKPYRGFVPSRRANVATDHRATHS